MSIPPLEAQFDWFSQNVWFWERLLGPLAGVPDIRALEVGCWEGRATRWLLEHILTGDGSTITVVDSFTGSPEHHVEGIDTAAAFARFWHNIAPFRERVDVWRGMSREILPQIIAGHTEAGTTTPVYDYVYVDGSHHADDVRCDGTLALQMLKVGGLMCFDDWAGWRYAAADGTVYCPADGIRAFLSDHAGRVEIVEEAYQLWVRRVR